MNQTQRKFLIDKIEKSVFNQIKALKSSKPESPSLNTYLLHAVMSDKFELKPIEEIRECIRQKALKSKDREDWLGNHWGSANKRNVSFEAHEIFVIPDEYKKLSEEYLKSTSEIDKKINDLRIQSDTLITRIQLASDKTLQTMINEIDDMGNISLMDTKLKLLQS